jgi:hypothetical protein
MKALHDTEVGESHMRQPEGPEIPGVAEKATAAAGRPAAQGTAWGRKMPLTGRLRSVRLVAKCANQPALPKQY